MTLTAAPKQGGPNNAAGRKRKRMNWIKVTDKLPPAADTQDLFDKASKPSIFVLVWANGFNKPMTGRYFAGIGIWQVDGIDTLGEGYPVTHWAEFKQPEVN